jgi:hypothetical protein
MFRKNVFIIIFTCILGSFSVYCTSDTPSPTYRADEGRDNSDGTEDDDVIRLPVKDWDAEAVSSDGGIVGVARKTQTKKKWCAFGCMSSDVTKDAISPAVRSQYFDRSPPDRRENTYTPPAAASGGASAAARDADGRAVAAPQSSKMRPKSTSVRESDVLEHDLDVAFSLAEIDLPPPPPLQEKSRSEVIIKELENFDPKQDVVFFDYDETIAHEPKSRERELLGRMFAIYRNLILSATLHKGAYDQSPDTFLAGGADYTPEESYQSVYIFSCGKRFLVDHRSGLARFDFEAFIPPSQRSWPVLKDRSFGVSLMDTEIFEYFPEFRAFFIKHDYMKEYFDDPRGIRIFDHVAKWKATALSSVLKFLGYSRERPVRNIYFIDNELSFLKNLSEAALHARGDGLVTGELIAMHVPYDYGQKR